MSLESSIANLVAIGGQNLTLPQQIAQTAETKLTEMAAAYQSYLSGLVTSFYVNQVTGLDTNPGTLAAPLKTIGKALTLTPRGGLCYVSLQAPYTVSQDITVDGRMLMVNSASSVRHAISFERVSDYLGTATLYRFMKNFDLKNGGSIAFRGVTLVMPPLDGTWPTMTLQGAYSGFVCARGSESYPIGGVLIGYCDITLPATPFAPMLGLNMVELNAFALTASGSLNGKWFGGYTNTAGVATDTLPWLLTNLDTI